MQVTISFHCPHTTFKFDKVACLRKIFVLAALFRALELAINTLKQDLHHGVLQSVSLSADVGGPHGAAVHFAFASPGKQTLWSIEGIVAVKN